MLILSRECGKWLVWNGASFWTHFDALINVILDIEYRGPSKRMESILQ